MDQYHRYPHLLPHGGDPDVPGCCCRYQLDLRSGIRFTVLDGRPGTSARAPPAHGWSHGTIGPMPPRVFDALGRHRMTRWALRSLVKRLGVHAAWDIPNRPHWNVGEVASEQGCPTVPPATG